MVKKFFIFVFVLFFTAACFAELYSKDAVVSYYAEDFHGKKTSNGETFNMNALTCASKELPFDTKVKVTNLANGKSVIVRVNDRGPFVPDRELDLSKAAAIKLDMIKTGTAHVKIEIVEMGPETKASIQTAEKAKKIMAQRYPGWKPHGTSTKSTASAGTTTKTTTTTTTKTTTKTTTVTAAPVEPGKYWDIQLGAFSTRENANKLAQQLLQDGFKDVVFQKSEGIFRVVIRQVPSKDLNRIKAQLEAKGYHDFTVRERKQ